MSKVSISGASVVITSSIKLSDLQTIAKFRPNALNLMGGKNGDELQFSVGLSKNAGCISNVGAFFGTETNGGFATITMLIEDFGGDKKEYIFNNFGGALAKLNELEATLPAVLDEVATQKEAIEASVTVE